MKPGGQWMVWAVSGAAVAALILAGCGGNSLSPRRRFVARSSTKES